MKNNGSFTISLDFELFWGVRDKRLLVDYRENLEGVWTVIPKILDLFNKYEIHTTWAIVGFLFFKDSKELQKNFPSILPMYKKNNLSSYPYIKDMENLFENKLHFAKELIELIKNTSNQEVASHTFSHFYMLEENSAKESFIKDTKSFMDISEKEKLKIKSIVLPRNQINKNSFNILKDHGITIYRGNPEHWAYKDGDVNKDFKKKVLRFLDTYVNLSGYKTSLPIEDNGIYNVKSSIFLRPYSRTFSLLENLKLRRIKNSMLHAAKNGENFHLWWHPHNFGINQEENLKNLEEILLYFHFLKEKYNMKSKTMKELVYG